MGDVRRAERWQSADDFFVERAHRLLVDFEVKKETARERADRRWRMTAQEVQNANAPVGKGSET